ncbi:hypothetical protein FACS189487_02580 [Campylobacterota bacterium]|nr:hypothetical protein FACS189487_02580 [Campylobacterota bacterium]
MKTPNIFVCFLLSFALHISLVIGYIFLHSLTFTNTRNSERLIVQIDGVISDKQQEDKAIAKPPPPKPTPPKPRVQKKIETAEKQIEQTPQIESTKTETPSDKEQQAETIKHDQDEAKEINRYLAGLKKQLSNHIAYPETAKQHGLIGVPTVGLSVLADGSVEGVMIVKSSGYAALDEAAVQAVRQAAPFAHPPRPLHNISIAIYFKRE